MKSITTIFLLIGTFAFSQNDSIIGPVKRVREKLVFLDSVIQNRKLFSTESEYGHYGFASRDHTLTRFESWWYHTYWSHYLNYDRELDSDRNILTETWFDKSNSIIRKYEYKYDTIHRQIQEKYTVGAAYAVTNTIYNPYTKKVSAKYTYSSDDLDRFSFSYFLINEKNQLIKVQKFDEEGPGTTNFNEYDGNGNKIRELVHRPYIWEQNSDNSKTYKRDPIGKPQVYSDLFYDEQNLLREQCFYNLESDNETALSSRIIYKYDKQKRKEYEYYARDKYI